MSACLLGTGYLLGEFISTTSPAFIWHADDVSVRAHLAASVIQAADALFWHFPHIWKYRHSIRVCMCVGVCVFVMLISVVVASKRSCSFVSSAARSA